MPVIIKNITFLGCNEVENEEGRRKSEKAEAECNRGKV